LHMGKEVRLLPLSVPNASRVSGLMGELVGENETNGDELRGLAPAFRWHALHRVKTGGEGESVRHQVGGRVSPRAVTCNFERTSGL